MRLAVLHVDHAYHATAGKDRNRQHGFVSVFGKFGEDFETGIERGVLRQRDRLAVLGYPAGDALADSHLEPVQHLRMRVPGGTQHQVLAFHHKDEAGIAAHMVGDELHNFIENLMQRIRSRDASA